MSQPWLVKEQDRCNYGLRWQQVIATNQAPNDVLGPHNFHYPPEKHVFAVQGQQDQQYIQDFETNIRSSLKDFLVSELSDCTWTLNVLRLGFKDNRSENPIVIHLCIQTPDYFLDAENNRDVENTRNNAIKVLEGMNKIISGKKKSSEKYFIDICQIENSTLRRSESNEKEGVDLKNNFHSLYTSYTPRPGISIGRTKLDVAGSLTGFLCQNNDTYALTCRHVALPDKDFRSRYKFRDEGQKLQMSMPAIKDHEVTKGEMKDNLDIITVEIANDLSEQAKNPHSDYALQNQTKEKEQNVYASNYDKALHYRTDAGHVYAAPEEWRKVPYYNGVLDWAIIHNHCTDHNNTLPRANFLRKAEISKLIKRKRGDDWSSSQYEAFIAKCQKLEKSTRFDIKNPSSSSALFTDRIYFKAPSRTLGWMACEMNGVRSIHHRKGHEVSEEYVFVGEDHGGAISGGGDSGALIYDIDIDTTNAEEPTAALMPMAMIWAGNNHGTIVSGFKDVTYATPIGAVLKDIECEMGWDEGSLKFC
ncbi:hypothetical protein BGAL_0568g00020 [Botrytis galanthina]|uniref:Uncharacterized protein n=1 Tax=Botrytis galanthina TaxID=278940 RepID=A0A4S8QIV8_9HELO|nr:hypothetical protein BGAL_0568g00020 [Botrytis galanthina]